MADIYDGVFRTIINDCRQFLVPLINEIFSEEYTGEEEIEFYPNEHFLDQQDEADTKRITDSCFRITGKTTRKYHLECESSLPDGRITVRLFEYDAQIALDSGEVTEETLTVTFPHTAVLYLRMHKKKKTPDKMKYIIVTPGGTVKYDVPVMKVQTYTIDDIFNRNLFILIPFYIFLYEENFAEYNSNTQKLKELEDEYRGILERLDKLEAYGKIGAFDKRTIIELSRDVIKEITQKYGKVQESVGGIMNGVLIETEAKKIFNQGINQGINQGTDETKRKVAASMLKDGILPVSKIAEYSGLGIEEVQSLKV